MSSETENESESSQEEYTSLTQELEGLYEALSYTTALLKQFHKKLGPTAVKPPAYAVKLLDEAKKEGRLGIAGRSIRLNENEASLLGLPANEAADIYTVFIACSHLKSEPNAIAQTKEN
jgi:hypothetical protein